ncbi:VCBS repeat-containing protein [bacterium]|nr:VCBS repeat-containing protein [bacterium]
MRCSYLPLNLFSLLLCLMASFASADLVSGEPIMLGDGTMNGPLSADAITSEPYGYAYLYGGEQPDLFVGSTSGLYLYQWLETDAETNAPVFGNRVRVSHPWDADIDARRGTVLQLDGTTYGVFIEGDELVICTFDLPTLKFTETARLSYDGLVPRNPVCVTIGPNADGTFQIVFGISDGTSSAASDFDRWDWRYRMYDGAGITRGYLSYYYLYGMRLSKLDETGKFTNIARITDGTDEVLFYLPGSTFVNLGEGYERDLIVGARTGVFPYRHNTAGETGASFEEMKFVADLDGLVMRHPNIRPSTIAYPDPETGLSNLISGGEGMISFNRFTGEFTENGAPIYGRNVPVLEANAQLYHGSLGVANTVDWNGDDVDDLVIGNSTGHIWYFENAGTNTVPLFQPGTYVEANGKPIQLQPGYWRDIQGPAESRWGYICPEVADWNEDGLPDIITGGSTAQYIVYMNVGTPTEPQFGEGKVLRLDGSELHGTWRSKAGVGKLGDRMAIVALDDQNEFHLYWRLDDYNVEDGGKLHLDDNRTITATPEFRRSGAMGRVKINLDDWDEDGATDLFVGTFGRTSIPSPDAGLPSHLLKKSSVLLLRNAGTDEEPVFEFPKYFASDGVQIYYGGHSIGPDVCHFGAFGRKGIVVANESGRVVFYHALKLSLETWEPGARAASND